MSLVKHLAAQALDGGPGAGERAVGKHDVAQVCTRVGTIVGAQIVWSVVLAGVREHLRMHAPWFHKHKGFRIASRKGCPAQLDGPAGGVVMTLPRRSQSQAHAAHACAQVE